MRMGLFVCSKCGLNLEENIKLIKPNNSFKNDYLDMISEWKEYGEELIPWSLNLDTDDFDSLVET